MAYPNDLTDLPTGFTANTREDATGYEHDVVHKTTNQYVNAIIAILGAADSDDTETIIGMLAFLLANNNSSWRFKSDGTFQLWNQDTGKYHALMPRGTGNGVYAAWGPGED